MSADTMWAMASTSDRARLVAVTAVAQAVTAPVTTWTLGPSFNIGAISDANISPVTPADYAFAVWGLIYAACIALAVYQLLPSQQERTVQARRCNSECDSRLRRNLRGSERARPRRAERWSRRRTRGGAARVITEPAAAAAARRRAVRVAFASAP
jgi:hypothetical protein